MIDFDDLNFKIVLIWAISVFMSSLNFMLGARYRRSPTPHHCFCFVACINFCMIIKELNLNKFGERKSD